jgi:hypothetical protein
MIGVVHFSRLIVMRLILLLIAVHSINCATPTAVFNEYKARVARIAARGGSSQALALERDSCISALQEIESAVESRLWEERIELAYDHGIAESNRELVQRIVSTFAKVMDESHTIDMSKCDELAAREIQGWVFAEVSGPCERVAATIMSAEKFEKIERDIRAGLVRVLFAFTAHQARGDGGTFMRGFTAAAEPVFKRFGRTSESVVIEPIEISRRQSIIQTLETEFETVRDYISQLASH